MVSYIWPVALIVLANTFYNICAKSFPSSLNPFAALTVTYLLSAALAFILYFVTKDDKSSLLEEYSRLNWVPFAFGFCLLGLETGFIYAFKAGWMISTTAIVSSVFLAVILLMVGFIFYGESINLNKVIGIAVCLLGLWIVNR